MPLSSIVNKGANSLHLIPLDDEVLPELGL